MQTCRFWTPFRRLVLLAATSSSLAASARADEYSEFRIPKHHWSSWTVFGQSSGNYSFVGQRDASQKQGDLGGRLGTSGTWGFDSDALQRTLSIDAFALGDRRHLEFDRNDTSSSFQSKGSNRNSLEAMSAAVSVRTYPFRFPIGVELSGSVQAALGQSWGSTDNRAVRVPEAVVSSLGETVHDSRVASAAFVTLGCGRVRDATVIYTTQLLELRLRSAGRLTRPLAPETRAKIAALFYAQPEFSVPRDRPDKYFWRELERILREDGALGAGTLDAFALFRLLEPAAAHGTPIRRSGFFVGPTMFVAATRVALNDRTTSSFSYFVNDSLVQSDVSSAEHSLHDRSDLVHVGAVAEYHRPIGPRWQTDAESRLDYVDAEHVMQTSTAVGASWLIADRWYADGKVEHLSAAKLGDHAQPPVWEMTYGTSLNYYLEDAWTIGLAWVARQSHAHDLYQRDAQFQLGVSYRVSGLLDLPGVMSPARLARGGS